MLTTLPIKGLCSTQYTTCAWYHKCYARAQKFEYLLDAHRWTGQQLDEATGGVVPRSYVTNLRKGRIESPGYEKLLAIAKTMDFPP